MEFSSINEKAILDDGRLQGALEHEHHEDLTEVVLGVDTAEPIVGPPRPEDAETPYFGSRVSGRDDMDQELGQPA